MDTILIFGYFMCLDLFRTRLCMLIVIVYHTLLSSNHVYVLFIRQQKTEKLDHPEFCLIFFAVQFEICICFFFTTKVYSTAGHSAVWIL